MSKVLVIDDNSDILEMLDIVLEMDGHEVSLANGGKVGLEKMKEVCPDVILLDYSMPDLSGIDVAKEARHLCEDLPIIFITAHGNLVEREVGEFDRAMIVQKPFRFGDLNRHINAMVQPH